MVNNLSQLVNEH